MSLREEIWEEVRPLVQDYRLNVEDGDGDLVAVAEGCRQVAEGTIRSRLARELNATGRVLSDDDLRWLREEVAALLGAGPLQRFLERTDVENIYCFGPKLVMLGLSGGRQEIVDEPVFTDEDDMIRYVAHLATTHGQTGRRFDQSSPLLDLRLRTGERVFAAMEVCGAPFLTVRCHRHRAVRLDDLVASGSLSEQAAGFLRAAVRPPGPANILVCGALGAGKTTLLRALLAEIGPAEVVCTLEQTFELFLDQSHPLTFAAETREANSDGSGEIPMEELAKRSLRSGADRVIVGELRGPEAATFLSACGTGSDGSMATIHASSTRQALSRLVRYCLAAGGAGIQSALVDEVAEVIHLVVHLRGDPRTGFRGVSSIAEVTSGDGERFETHEIFGRRARDAPLELRAAPRNPEVIDRILEGGLDTSQWATTAAPRRPHEGSGEAFRRSPEGGVEASRRPDEAGAGTSQLPLMGARGGAAPPPRDTAP